MRACLCAGFAFNVCNVSAQSQTKKLEDACRRMFDKGNSWFILGEAFKDGFISEGRSFHYRFFAEDSLITIDDKAVPEPYQSRYKKLLRSFEAAHPGVEGVGSLHCDGIYLSQFLCKYPSLGMATIKDFSGTVPPESVLPAGATEAMNEHFKKLAYYYDYYDRMDTILQKEKPYAELFRYMPFDIYMVQAIRGDTVSMLTYILHHTEGKDRSVSIFEHAQKMWDYEGLGFPVYDEAEVKNCPVDIKARRHLLFKVRYLQEGSDCMILQKS
jgi:hypothetical protein